MSRHVIKLEAQSLVIHCTALMLTSRSKQLGTLSLYHRKCFSISYILYKYFEFGVFEKKKKVGEANAMEEGILRWIVRPRGTSRSNHLRFEMHFHVALPIGGNQLLTFCFVI